MNRLPCASIVLLSSAAIAMQPSLAAPSNDGRRAEILVRELGCTSCHRDPEPALLENERPGPDLTEIGSRRTLDSLREFILAPDAHKPGTRMPSMLSGRSAEQRLEEASDLAHYLASFGGPLETPAEELTLEAVEAGRQLYHSVGCVACHVPMDEAWALERALWSFDDAMAPLEEPRVLGHVAGASEDPLGRAVTLGPLVGTRTLEGLTRFLEDPLATRPHGRMPDLHLTAEEAAHIASYLFFEDALGTPESTVVPGRARGLAYAYVEAWIPNAGTGLGELAAVRRGAIEDLGSLPPHRDDEFGFRYSGFVHAPKAGRYRFHTTSDDGSWLWVDGELVVDNGGAHGMVRKSGELYLDAGKHALAVHFFERSGGEGLIVEWTEPGGEREIIPVEYLSHEGLRLEPGSASSSLDPERVARGRQAFAGSGCAACHVPPEPVAPGLARPWERLLPSDGACYEAHGIEGRPSYALEAADRALLAQLITEDDRSERSAKERLGIELDRMRCSACHRSDATSGPDSDRLPYFQVDTRAELGDEGRIPPSLDGVGGKLRPAWLTTVLEEGGGVRPYMRTRMPRFGEANVAGLAGLLAAVEDVAKVEGGWEPEVSRERIVNGRRLAGTDGLGCIQCHDFAGHASLGVPAVDLATVSARLQPDWFRRLLIDPGAINMNTRMPSFWLDGRSPVRDVYDGDPEEQTAALWAYLQLGDAMPLPAGLIAEEGVYELVVEDKAVLCGVFFEGVSPRTLVVGHPELVHYAYDVQGARLAKAWRGRFFNAEGTWHGRAGALEDAPSEDAIAFVDGPSITGVDPTGADPWPETLGEELRILGRRFDAERRPRFRYAVLGVEIEEAIVPSADLDGLRRTFRVGAGEGATSLTLRLAREERITRQGGGWIVEGSGARFSIRGAEAVLRHVEGLDELLVPLAPGGEVEVEVRW